MFFSGILKTGNRSDVTPDKAPPSGHPDQTLWRNTRMLFQRELVQKNAQRSIFNVQCSSKK
jgi:hypothetical protein